MAAESHGTARPPRFVRPAGGAGAPAARPTLGATTTPWVLDLIERFRAAGPSLRECEHLIARPDDAAVWRSTVPGLRSCRQEACVGAVAAALEDRLGRPPGAGPTRCTTCGRVGVPVRGVGVAVGTTMLRGTVCDDCLAARPVPTPATITDPAPAPASVAGGPVEVADEPLVVDPEALAAAEDRVPFDAVGRRALRRGWLMADACCRATTGGLDEQRAVVAGLMVRAAKLARGLAGAPSSDAAFVDELAFRALVESTTMLWWSVRGRGGAVGPADDALALGGSAPADATGSPGDAAASPSDVDPLREHLRDLGREQDLEVLLGSSPAPTTGSWRALVGRHLSPGPTGVALDLRDEVVGPMQALVAGEHLALACVAYAERMPTTLDPDHLRPLAEEVTALRAAVGPAFAEATAAGRLPD